VFSIVLNNCLFNLDSIHGLLENSTGNFLAPYSFSCFNRLIKTRSSVENIILLLFTFLRAKAVTAFSASQPPQFCLSVCPSVRPFVTRVDQSKTVQARITKSSPSAAWNTLVSGTVKLFHKFKGGHPEPLNEKKLGKICDFWPISRCISVTVRVRA